MMDKIMALYWDFWQIPYFKIFIKNGKTVVKVYNQKAVSDVKGSTFALICSDLKMAWEITEDYLQKKAQFIFIVDVKNAIPVKIIETIEISGNIIKKEVKTKRVIIDNEKLKKNPVNGKPSTCQEIDLPPTLLYELIQAHFITNIMSEPLSKWAELKWVFIAALIVAGLLLYTLISGGTKLL